MNDKYLWDRTGEPDPEIQELEEILGTLRYQPRPLEIPADIRVAKKRNFVPWAIAASIALVVIGAALWFQISRSQPAPAHQAKQESPVAPPRAPAPGASPKQQVTSAGPEEVAPPQRRPRRIQIARHRVAPRQPALTPQELAEKEQVIDALRLVSAKLNLAQRKVQGLPQKNIFRNQNRIG